jgi:hypothetical protein
MDDHLGRKLLIESLEHDPDAHWVGVTRQWLFDIRFHYEGQKRVRKVLALVARIEQEDDEASHRACAAVFEDIRTAIGGNTAQWYTRGIQTPTTFHEFTLTVPTLEERP